MSEQCDNTTRLNRDGTSRQQRLLKSLLPGNLAVDERKTGDLLRFIKKLAAEVNYYGINNEIIGSWEGFLDGDKDLQHFLDDNRDPEAAFQDYIERKNGHTEPHIALLLTFLKLYKTAQGDLNLITEKHLDFYYKEVLRLRNVAPVPDKAFLTFKLARHVEGSHRIPEGSALKAGKDDTGKPLTYRTARELMVNHGQVEQIKAVFADVSNPDNTFRLFASPVANSSDGLGTEIEAEDQSWLTFGDPDRAEAEIGFAITSPLLLLSEGDRTVTLTLQFDKSPATSDQLGKLSQGEYPLAKYAFQVLFSGEEEWISPGDEEQLLKGNEELPEKVKDKVLAFVNTAPAEKIATKVKDDPTRGYSTVRRGYAIGVKVAQAILEERKKGNFTTLDKLRQVQGLGPDKIDDLVYTFGGNRFKTKVDTEQCTITITRTINEGQPSVVAYNREILQDQFRTKWPVMKVLLRKRVSSLFEDSIYKSLKGLRITGAGLTVTVEGMKSNIVQNDSGLLDAGKPFMPFGNRPAPGSSFYVGNQELFQKNPQKIWINAHWHDLPDSSFGTHYDLYARDPEDSSQNGNGSGNRQNDSFKASISVLDRRKWKEVSDSRQLFESGSNDQPVEPERDFFLGGEALTAIGREPELGELTGYNTGSQRGYIRFRLKGVDFGHKDYAPAYTRQAIKAIEDAGTVFPNEPYTPVIEDLSIDYTSTADLDFKEDPTDQFLHVAPFGTAFPEIQNQSALLLPSFNSEGNLYIGFRDFNGGQTLSMLVRVAEGSADPGYLRQPVGWSYLSDNRWIPFDEREILSDTTDQLLTSGIITFNVPRQASLDHTLLPAGLVWIRAGVQKDTPAVSRLVDIRTQAVEALFEDNDNDPGHLSEPLEAGTINKLAESDSAVKEVHQPYNSFGGTMKELPVNFYTRVSERLRHKHRAVTIWDYERLVLQQFPSVYKVKCLNHTYYEGSMKGYSEIAPGHVSLVVVSDMTNKNAVDPLKPKTSLIMLTEIDRYIRQLKAHGVELHVRNPLYEEIRVKFNVKFHHGRDGGYYSEVLNTEIKSFLSPWAYKSTPDVVFGGKIHKSRILHFIETRAYVDFVTCLKMSHRIPGENGNKVKEVDEAKASTVASVLGSAPGHTIHVLEQKDCSCDDNEVSAYKELETDNCGC
ncbi:MAG: hypothetical protein WD266_02925 [Balneolales bacterium]